jgi:hypothetical protein
MIVFPAPEGPMMKKYSPSLTVNEISFRANSPRARLT